MKIIAKILAGLVALVMTITGIFFLLKPEMAAQSAGLSIENTFGFSSIRGLIGGTMLMTAGFAFYAIFMNRKELLNTTGMIALAWTLGRVISIMFDGMLESSVNGILLSFGMFVFIVISFRLWEKSDKIQTQNP